MNRLLIAILLADIVVFAIIVYELSSALLALLAS